MKKLLVLAILTALLSCNDDDTPGISITSPKDGETFNGGQTVQVKVKITDDGDSIMNEWLFVISEENDTIVNFRDDEFAFDYTITQSFQVQSNRTYKIRAKARGGHGHWGTKTIYVSGE
ncbi:MAG: hypothetical protein EOO50_15840 [Flavobacterium sp.]|uniref:Ig-like domain-containing protein n=1 Tax=Flavobacterium sp. TaxID=239 RepID=UPI00121156BF|nr:Ig-like domain-containing protein [Flavobacterium sp.]RZJ64369.1 MAG: hypothetical protein EOO50_15840 [Flavobacterium sp.]